jgi:DNA-binding NarL/FixJ family response regulator
VFDCSFDYGFYSINSTLLGKASIRVLVVDDYEPWRRFLSTALQKELELHIIGEGCDGLEAVYKAEELQPDLILLDIGLPTLNGIEASRRIRKLSPAAKIILVSENRSPEIAQEALSTGARGYIVKSDVASELARTVHAVLEGKRFVSPSLSHKLTGPPDPQSGARFPRDNMVTLIPPQGMAGVRHHEARFIRMIRTS